MSLFAQWAVLAWFIGPLRSALALFLTRWLLGRWTLGAFCDPFTWLRSLWQLQRLHRSLRARPYDRLLRFQLARLLLLHRWHRVAFNVLRPSVEGGDHSTETLFTFALACFGAGHFEQGEALLSQVEQEDPRFGLGAVHLERGRWRLRRGDFAGAKAALEALLLVRPGTVEGRVLLARALRRLGERAAAQRMRAAAWREYVEAPLFHRRRERAWAWQAQPLRPVLFAALFLAPVLFLGPLFRWGVEAGTERLASAMRPIFAQAFASALPEGPRPLNEAPRPPRAPQDWKGWSASGLWFGAPARFKAMDPDDEGFTVHLEDPEGAVLKVEAQPTEAGGCDGTMARMKAERLADFRVEAFRFASAAAPEGLRIESKEGGRSYLLCHGPFVYILALTAPSLTMLPADADSIAATAQLFTDR